MSAKRKSSTVLRKILLPTDGSEQAEHQIEVVVEIARATGATITVVHVFSPPGPLRRRGQWMAEDLRASFEEEAKETASDVAGRLAALGLPVTATVVEGTPAEGILRAIEDEKPDLVVMNSRGASGLPGILMGSVAERVVRHSAVPVLVLK